MTVEFLTPDTSLQGLKQSLQLLHYRMVKIDGEDISLKSLNISLIVLCCALSLFCETIYLASDYVRFIVITTLSKLIIACCPTLTSGFTGLKPPLCKATKPESPLRVVTSTQADCATQFQVRCKPL
jgi:hypothetical protein